MHDGESMRAKTRKRQPHPRIKYLNRAYARQIEELYEREQHKRLYPEPEPIGRYRP